MSKGASFYRFEYKTKKNVITSFKRMSANIMQKMMTAGGNEKNVSI